MCVFLYFKFKLEEGQVRQADRNEYDTCEPHWWNESAQKKREKKLWSPNIDQVPIWDGKATQQHDILTITK